VRFDIKNHPVISYFGLNLGSFHNDLPFLFPVDYLANHVLVTGQTGTGKTRFAENLAIESENYAKPNPIRLLIIDVEGEWKNVIPRLVNRTEYFSVKSNLKINPFDLEDPALIRDLMQETVFKGIEKEYADLSAQMTFVLQETISESKSIEDLVHKIKTYHNHKLTNIERTRTALLVRLDPFLRSPLKEIFLCKKSNPDFHTMGDYNTVIDLHHLDSLVAYRSELRLIYNTITTYFLRKMLNRGTCNWVTNLFVADEAQMLVPKILQKMIVTESWPATEFATRLRKRGCGLVLITQSISNLEKDIVKNAGTKVVFRTQDGEDSKIVSEFCGFYDETERQYISNVLSKLESRQAIVSTMLGEPFLINSRQFSLPEVGNLESDLNEKHDSDSRAEDDFDPDAKTFLSIMKSHPFASVTEKRSILGWNGQRYERVVESLRKGRVIEIIPVRLGRGAPKILYQIPGSNPSIKHEFYVNWICELLQKNGFECTKNKVGPDIEIPKLNTAIEVELGYSDITRNINHDIQNFDKTLVCSDDKKLIEDLSGQFKSKKIFFLQIQHLSAFIEKMQARNELQDI